MFWCEKYKNRLLVHIKILPKVCGTLVTVGVKPDFLSGLSFFENFICMF